MSTSSTEHRWPWWHRQTPRTRRTIRATLALLVTGLLSLAVGVGTATTESSLGPHEADYAVTLDREVRLNLGPLGSIIMDSPLPWPLGARVVVHEIPAEVLAEGQSPLPGLSADLAAYGQLFTVPEAAVADAVNGLVADAVGRTVVIWSVLLVLIAAGRLASRGQLREEVKAALARPGVAPLVTAVALATVATPLVPAMQQQEPEGHTLRLLHGTPLQDARITGRLASLVDTYGSVVVSAYRDNEAFYAETQENLTAALAADGAARAPRDVPAVDPALRTDDVLLSPPDLAVPSAPEGTAGDAPGAAGEGTEEPADGHASPGDGAVREDGAGAEEGTGPEDGASAEEGSGPQDGTSPDGGDGAPAPQAGQEPADGAVAPRGTDGTPEIGTPAPDPVTFLFVSDLHCNVGMADVVAEAAELTGAAAVLDGGDTVMSGTSVESYCINAFAGAIPPDLPWVVATGNHDSVLTAEQARAAGFTVLDGEVVDVGGVRVLGATDPTLTALGQGTVPEREETIPELASRLAEVACAAGDPPPLLLVHNPRAGEVALDRGCVELQLSGHWHRRVGPEPAGQGLRYVSTSSGGGAEGGATVGPLRSTAEMTVLRVDAETGRPLDYRVLQLHPDASVELGQWFAFPRPGPVLAAPDGTEETDADGTEETDADGTEETDADGSEETDADGTEGPDAAGAEEPTPDADASTAGTPPADPGA